MNDLSARTAVKVHLFLELSMLKRLFEVFRDHHVNVC